MKKLGIVLAAWALLQGSAWAQFYPTVRTVGRVSSNAPAVFADGSGRMIKAGVGYDWVLTFSTNDLLRTANIDAWTEGDLSGVAWASFVRTNNSALTDARPTTSTLDDVVRNGHIVTNQNIRFTPDYPPDEDSPQIEFLYASGFMGGVNTGRLGFASTKGFYADSSKVWTMGNDGGGSGLDADLLDGAHAAAFATAAQGTDARPTTSTLEQVVANGGTVASNAITIDAAGAHTNTLGGKLVKLGSSVQSGGTPTASGAFSVAMGGANSVATGTGSVVLGGGRADFDSSTVINALTSPYNASTNQQLTLGSLNGTRVVGGQLTHNGTNVALQGQVATLAEGALAATAVQPSVIATSVWDRTQYPLAITDGSVFAPSSHTGVSLASGAHGGEGDPKWTTVSNTVLSGVVAATGHIANATAAHAASAISATGLYANVQSAINGLLPASYLVPTILTPAPTVTVTQANGPLVSLAPTSATTLVFPSLSALGVGEIMLCLSGTAYSVTWSNANSRVYWATAPTIPTNGWATNMLLMRMMGVTSNYWIGRQ